MNSERKKQLHNKNTNCNVLSIVCTLVCNCCLRKKLRNRTVGQGRQKQREEGRKTSVAHQWLSLTSSVLRQDSFPVQPSVAPVERVSLWTAPFASVIPDSRTLQFTKDSFQFNVSFSEQKTEPRFASFEMGRG